MSLARKHAPADDPTYYPSDDDMGEALLHLLIREMLRPLLARFLAEQGVVALVGSNQFIYWQQYAPTKCVAPDVYVLPGVPPNSIFKSWKVWEHDVVPSFALEVVSDDYPKDSSRSRKRSSARQSRRAKPSEQRGLRQKRS